MILVKNNPQKKCIFYKFLLPSTFPALRRVIKMQPFTKEQFKTTVFSTEISSRYTV